VIRNGEENANDVEKGAVASSTNGKAPVTIAGGTEVKPIGTVEKENSQLRDSEQDDATMQKQSSSQQEG
jgi:hypothetical protein